MVCLHAIRSVAVFHAVLTTLGEIGSGSESSPLSVNSTFAEILRLVQVGIFAGILYLVNMVKSNHHSNDEAHGEVLSDVKELKREMKALTESVSQITKGGPTA